MARTAMSWQTSHLCALPLHLCALPFTIQDCSPARSDPDRATTQGREDSFLSSGAPVSSRDKVGLLRIDGSLYNVLYIVVELKGGPSVQRSDSNCMCDHLSRSLGSVIDEHRCDSKARNELGSFSQVGEGDALL